MIFKKVSVLIHN